MSTCSYHSACFCGSIYKTPFQTDRECDTMATYACKCHLRCHINVQNPVPHKELAHKSLNNSLSHAAKWLLLLTVLKAEGWPFGRWQQKGIIVMECRKKSMPVREPDLIRRRPYQKNPRSFFWHRRKMSAVTCEWFEWYGCLNKGDRVLLLREEYFDWTLLFLGASRSGPLLSKIVGTCQLSLL